MYPVCALLCLASTSMTADSRAGSLTSRSIGADTSDLEEGYPILDRHLSHVMSFHVISVYGTWCSTPGGQRETPASFQQRA